MWTKLLTDKKPRAIELNKADTVVANYLYMRDTADFKDVITCTLGNGADVQVHYYCGQFACVSAIIDGTEYFGFVAKDGLESTAPAPKESPEPTEPGNTDGLYE